MSAVNADNVWDNCVHVYNDVHILLYVYANTEHNYGLIHNVGYCIGELAELVHCFKLYYSVSCGES